jgi:uncharacterized protein YcbK (DUF882 family)
MNSLKSEGRRRFLGLAAGTAVALIAAPAIAAPRFAIHRQLALLNVHTGEKLDCVYGGPNGYDKSALKRFAWLLRDHRNDEVHAIDPKLLDLLSAVTRRLDARQPTLVLSGYRSPETNEMLAQETEGVAKNSFHLAGKAIDLVFPGKHLDSVRRAALALKGGGVGYYPQSNFVHIDVGPVRHW